MRGLPLAATTIHRQITGYMSDKKKGCLRGLKIIGLIILGIVIILRITFGKRIDKEDLINNYEKKSKEIYQLKDYMYSVVPNDFIVNIEFKSRRRIDLKVYQKSDTAKDGSITWFQYWDINPYNYKEEPQTDYEKKYKGITKSLDTVKSKLNWTESTFKEIKSRLDNANCISITCNKVYKNRCEIGYQRFLMSKYSYMIFDENLTKEEQDKNTDDCRVQFYKDNVVLKYGSGAIGSLCSDEFKNDNNN